ncbi:unnamed protein product [Merluccius merluccius]
MAGSTVEINCSCPQRPPLSVDWVRTPDSDLEAEEPVTPEKVLMNRQTGPLRATLRLLNVTPEASGVYYCKVNGTRGPGTGLEVVRPINIHKAEYRSRMKDALIFLQAVMLAICVAAPLLQRYALAGRTVVIHCRFPQRPPLSVDWVRTPDLDLEAEEPVTPKPKVVMEEQTGRPSATLRLLNVTPEASGVYYCKVNGTRGPGTGLEVILPACTGLSFGRRAPRTPSPRMHRGQDNVTPLTCRGNASYPPGPGPYWTQQDDPRGPGTAAGVDPDAGRGAGGVKRV